MNYIVTDTAEMNALTTMVADDTCYLSSTQDIYIYQDSAWVLFRSSQPLVFRGITFEQTDYWHKPEFVFRGFSFEELFVKKSNISLFHGMS